MGPWGDELRGKTHGRRTRGRERREESEVTGGEEGETRERDERERGAPILPVAAVAGPRCPSEGTALQQCEEACLPAVCTVNKRARGRQRGETGATARHSHRSELRLVLDSPARPQRSCSAQGTDRNRRQGAGLCYRSGHTHACAHARTYARTCIHGHTHT